MESEEERDYIEYIRCLEELRFKIKKELRSKIKTLEEERDQAMSIALKAVHLSDKLCGRLEELIWDRNELSMELQEAELELYEKKNPELF